MICIIWPSSFSLTICLRSARSVYPCIAAEGRHLQEIRNSDFPTYYKDEYEYAYPSLGSSTGPGMKNVEGDKSIVAEGRQITFLKHVDRTLQKYLKTSMPLIVAGVDEELANFSHATRHSKNIIGLIKGNYAVDALHLLSDLAWEKVNAHIIKSHDAIIKKLEEDIGKKMAIDGIRDVWAMAKLGKGLVLLVEKDYHSAGYVDPSNEVKLYLNPPHSEASSDNRRSGGNHFHCHRKKRRYRGR